MFLSGGLKVSLRKVFSLLKGAKENSDKVQHDWFVGSCERDGLISHNALSPY